MHRPMGQPPSDRRRRRAHLWHLAILLGIPLASLPSAQADDHPLMPTSSRPHEYRQAAPGYRYEFPRDHGSHDEYRTEWWYYTGHLSTGEGRWFGFELTFFRRAVTPPGSPSSPSAWSVDHLYLAHAAVTDVSGRRFHYEEKISRAGLGKAGATRERLHVWIDRWHADARPEPGAAHQLTAQTPNFSLDLQLTPQRPPVIHGRDGVSRKGAKSRETSHYYSFTRLATQGLLTLDGTEHHVTGLSWMDHEFGSGDLGEALVGWDWFSIQLTNQTEVMVYRLRRADGQADAASSGTVIRRDGQVLPLAARDVTLSVLDYWNSPASTARYPHGWELRIPPADLVLTLHPLLKEQELITSRSTQVIYWEGAVGVTGQMEGQPVDGQGYVELTGYARTMPSPP